MIIVVLLCNFWTALWLSLSRLQSSAFWPIMFINHSKLNYSKKPNTLLLFLCIEQVHLSRSNSATIERQIKISCWGQTTKLLNNGKKKQAGVQFSWKVLFVILQIHRLSTHLQGLLPLVTSFSSWAQKRQCDLPYDVSVWFILQLSC